MLLTQSRDSKPRFPFLSLSETVSRAIQGLLSEVSSYPASRLGPSSLFCDLVFLTLPREGPACSPGPAPATSSITLGITCPTQPFLFSLASLWVLDPLYALNEICWQALSKSMLPLAILSTAAASEDSSQVGRQHTPGVCLSEQSSQPACPPHPCSCLGLTPTPSILDPGEGQNGREPAPPAQVTLWLGNAASTLCHLLGTWRRRVQEMQLSAQWRRNLPRPKFGCYEPYSYEQPA